MLLVEDIACRTRQSHVLAQADMDWSEFKAAVTQFQLPSIQPSSASDADHRAATVCQHSGRRPFMARTVSSKAHSVADAARRQSSDNTVLISAMYQSQQRAQIWARPATTAVTHQSKSVVDQPCSKVPPYMRAHTGGLALTYGNRCRDQAKVTATLINAMREASTLPKPPKTSSCLVTQSRKLPGSSAALVARSGRRVRMQVAAGQADQQCRLQKTAVSS